MSNVEDISNNVDAALTSRISRILSFAKKSLKGKDRNRLVFTQIINALLGLISGKLIATYINPEELGAYNLQFGAFTFFSGLFISPLLQFKKASYQNYIGEFGYRNFLKSFTMYACILMASLLLFFKFYHNGDFLTLPFILILFLIIPINYFNGFMVDQFNILGNLRIFSRQSVINNLSGAVFIAVMCIFVSSTGALTLWTMQIMMAIFGLLFFSHRIIRYKVLKTEAFTSFLLKQAKFTIPLIILAFFSWISNYFDRYIIEANLGLEEVGIYNVNYGLGSKFFLMLSPIFLVMLTPHVFQPNTIKLKKDTIEKYLKVYFALGILLVFIIFVFSDMIGQILLSDQYEEGFYLIYCTALSTLILTATYLLETLLYAEHKTKTILISNIFAAGLSVLLNLLFIPVLGMTGAIIASLIASSGRFIYTFFIYRKI